MTDYEKGYQDALLKNSYSLVKEDPSFSEEKQQFYSKQRKERGFDDTELWNLNTTIAQFILPRLKEFRKGTVGYPAKLSSFAEWKKILNKMTKYFSDYLEEKEPDEEGIKLFAKHFMDLWD